MKILHTSDWHLGNTWSGRSRREEFQAFLDWMVRLLEEERVDLLLIAGDVFDTASPGPVTQGMYFDFLRRAATLCRAVVVVAGNHDSPNLLDAPKDLLRHFNVHVVGVAPKADRETGRELVVLSDDDGRPEAIVAAVPFLRERDLRLAEAGESAESRDLKTVQGIRDHYARVCAEAERVRAGREIPLIATGHLFAAGARTSEEVRDIQVGTLDRLGPDVFPDEIDYLALGHLHLAQDVGGMPSRRYCGSPLPMSFDRVGRGNTVDLVEFRGRMPTVRSVPVPRFANLARISGNLEEIEKALKELAESAAEETILEVVYTGTEPAPDLPERVESLLESAKGKIHVLRIRSPRPSAAQWADRTPENLEELRPEDVFERLLDELRVRDGTGLDESLEAELKALYAEILRDIPPYDPANHF